MQELRFEPRSLHNLRVLATKLAFLIMENIQKSDVNIVLSSSQPLFF